MNKNDKMAIIKACEDFAKLDSIVSKFTDGTGIGTDFRGLWNLATIIQRNGKIDDLSMINGIIENQKLSSEQKCDMLFE